MDPVLNRFLQRDPLRWLAGANLYVYVGNNALRFLDPLGLFKGKEFAKGIGLLAGFGAYIVLVPTVVWGSARAIQARYVALVAPQLAKWDAISQAGAAFGGANLAVAAAAAAAGLATAVRPWSNIAKPGGELFWEGLELPDRDGDGIEDFFQTNEFLEGLAALVENPLDAFGLNESFLDRMNESFLDRMKRYSDRIRCYAEGLF